MSSHLRSGLTQRLGRIVETSNRLDGLLNGADEAEWDRQKRNTVLHHVRQLESMVAVVDTKVREWQALMVGDERVAEQALFDDYRVRSLTIDEILDGAEEMIVQARTSMEIAGMRVHGPAQEGEVEAEERRERGGEGEPAPHRRDVQGENQAEMVREIRQTTQRPEERESRENQRWVRHQLPTLQLKEFNGEPREWPGFWQSFSAAIDDQPLPAHAKMNYLLGVLKGEAARAVEGYTVNDGNYRLVVDMLRRRFGDPKRVADQLISELMNLPRSDDNLAALRRTAEAIERITRQFDQLGIEQDSSMLMTTVKSKLPQEALKELVREEHRWKQEEGREQRRWGMAELRQALEVHIQLAEQVAACVKTVKAPKREQARPGEAGGTSADELPGTWAFAAQAGRETSKEPSKSLSKITCYFCGEGHFADQCKSFPDVETRRTKLKELGSCFKCLRTGHHAKSCPKPLKCRRCGKEHPAALHYEGGPPRAPEKRDPVTGANAEPITKTSANYAVQVPNQPLLMTREVKIRAKDGEHVKGLVFLDPGSQINFVRRHFLQKLQVEAGSKEVLHVYPFGAGKPQKFASSIHHLLLETPDGSEELVEAYASGRIGARMQTLDRNGLTSQEPDVLLGVKDFWRFFHSHEQVGKGLNIVRTSIGNFACGQWDDEMAWGQSKPSALAVYSVTINAQENWPTADEVREWWSLESIGIRDDPDANDDQEMVDHFYRTFSRKEDGRFVVAWPWKEFPPKLSDNYDMAYSRLCSLLRMLRKNPELKEKYVQGFRDDEKKGVIERATRNRGQLEHFVPHSPIVTPEKARRVIDPSAHRRGEACLNSCFFRGPVILPQLVGVLMRFRRAKYPLLSDLEAAFHALELYPEDRELTKTLFVEDVDKEPDEPGNLIIYRFVRMAFGVVSAPAMLGLAVQQVLADARQSSDRLERIVGARLQDNCYVDNTLIECETKEEAEEMAWAAHRLFARAKMHLRSMLCNAPGFYMPPELRLTKPNPKVLGLPWLLEDDQLRIDFPVERATRVTRRGILQVLGKVFDPLGLVNPCLLKAKIQVQELIEGVGWDEVLTKEGEERWRETEEGWLGKSLRIPRRTPAAKMGRIHCFVDASKDAFSCAVYVVAESSQLVFAKTRLRPKSGNMTIPRLELAAMLVGVRAVKTVSSELGLPKNTARVWGDSKIVLAWINSRDEQERFVTNRLKEIRKHDQLTFAYVETKQNPADMGTRGAEIEELQKCAKWWQGPSWLTMDEERWPSEMVVKVEPRPGEEVVVSLVNATEPKPDVNGGEWPWMIVNRETGKVESRWRSWRKAVRVMTRVRRFIKACRGARYQDAQDMSWLPPEEIKQTHEVLLRIAQREVAADFRKRGLRLRETETGVLRLETRIERGKVEESFKCPMALPRKSQAAELIIADIHQRLCHAGTDRTLAEFLAAYWMPCARRMVKKIVRRCEHCIRIRAPSFSLPSMPQLPADRVQARRPFDSIGIDYLGPTKVRTRRREVVKMWVLLITCLCTRAVWLAPVRSMNADVLLQELLRFVARRGRPSFILSDNGTQFRALMRAFMATLDPATAPRWWHTGEHSPWQGGIFERIVALVKEAFKASLGRKILTWEEALTFTTQVEASINQRPLTYVSPEPDAVIPLRPIDFLSPGAELQLEEDGSVRNIEGENFSLTRETLLKHWQRQTKTLEHFWARFSREYLQTLRDRSRWEHPGKGLRRTPRVGEVVLVEEPMKPRNLWKVARIEELETRAGAVRNVALRAETGRVIHRPVNKIYPLEVEDDENPVPEPLVERGDQEKQEQEESEGENSDEHVDDTGEDQQSPQPSARTQRRLARAAKKAALAAVMLSMTGAGACELVCEAGGAVAKTVTEAFGCCTGAKCVTVKKDQATMVPATGKSYTCNLVCRGSNETDVGETRNLRCDGSTWMGLLFALPMLLLLAIVARKLGRKWLGKCRRGRKQKGRNKGFSIQVRPVAGGQEGPPERDEGGFVSVPLQLPRAMDGPTAPMISAITIGLMLMISGTEAEWNCTKAGVTARMETSLKVELCCNGMACAIGGGPIWSLGVPKEMLLKGYRCEGKTYTNGTIGQFQLRCPPREKCELVECWMCYEMVMETGCQRWWMWLAWGGVGGAMLALGTALGWGAKKIGKAAITLAGRQWAKRTLTKPHRSRENSYRRLSKLSTLGLLLALAGRAYAEDALVSTALTEQCITQETGILCEFNFATTLTLLPAGQEITLILKGVDGKVAGSLKMSMRALTIACEKRVKYWTYPYEIAIEAQKRCAGDDSCQEGACSKLEPGTVLPELPEAAKWPRFMSCLPCKKWWCSCSTWLPNWNGQKDDCFFYSYYAKERPGAETQMRFDCPVWRHEIEIDIELEIGNETQRTERRTVLNPGMSFKMGNLSLTPLAISQAPAPVLAVDFISDGMTMALATDLPEDLTCSTMDDAFKRNCSLHVTACVRCEASDQEGKVDCQCRDLEDATQNPARTLPITIGALKLRSSKEEVFAETTAAPVQLLVRAEGLRTVQVVDRTSCRVQVLAVTGCYDCATGATVTFTCETARGQTLMEVTCPSGVFVSRCDHDKKNYTATMTFAGPEVDEECRAECSGDSETFRLQGTLGFVPELMTRYDHTLAGGGESEVRARGSWLAWPSWLTWPAWLTWPDWGWPEWVTTFSVMVSKWIEKVIMVLLGVSLALAGAAALCWCKCHPVARVVRWSLRGMCWWLVLEWVARAEMNHTGMEGLIRKQRHTIGTVVQTEHSISYPYSMASHTGRTPSKEEVERKRAATERARKEDDRWLKAVLREAGSTIETWKDDTRVVPLVVSRALEDNRARILQSIGSKFMKAPSGREKPIEPSSDEQSEDDLESRDPTEGEEEEDELGINEPLVKRFRASDERVDRRQQKKSHQSTSGPETSGRSSEGPMRTMLRRVRKALAEADQIVATELHRLPRE